jgi:hypothetical protein
MPKWYQSLYWRIAIGFVLFLAAMLALQAGALVYLIAGMEVAPGPPPPELTRLVARELSEALTANPKLDIQQFFRQEYEGQIPLAAIMKDGRVVTTSGPAPSDTFVREVRDRLNADPESFMRGRGGRGRPVGPRPMRPETGSLARPGQPALRRTGPAGAVFMDGVPVGVVVALPRSAFRQLGPTLAVVGVVLVVFGTAAPCARDCGVWKTPRARSARET